MAIRRATYQDVLDAPAHRVAEIVDGTLYVGSRPGQPPPRGPTLSPISSSTVPGAQAPPMASAASVRTSRRTFADGTIQASTHAARQSHRSRWPGGRGPSQRWNRSWRRSASRSVQRGSIKIRGVNVADIDG